MKKRLFVVLLVLLPYGLPEAQEIRCDTTYKLSHCWSSYTIHNPCCTTFDERQCVYDTIITCDTFWLVDTTEINDSLRYEIWKWMYEEEMIDSLLPALSPDWQDSIEACKEKIKEVEFELSKIGLSFEELKEGDIWEHYIYLTELHHWQLQELSILRLQIQIFQLQKRLEGE